MSESLSIDQLKAKHQELENALLAEEAKLQPDEMTVADIKKKKLMIKDEIVRLEHV